jgi:tetratricopeptide (TPR) repeat protein
VGGAEALTDLGDVYRRQGDTRRPQTAIVRLSPCSARPQTAAAKPRRSTASARPCTPRDEAGAQHAAALRLAVETGERYEEARAYSGLAHCHHAIADDEQARHHWRQALSLYTDLGVPDADDARDRLTTLEQGAYAR